MRKVISLKLPSLGQMEGIPEEIKLYAATGKEISALISSFTDASIEFVINQLTEPKLNPDLLCDEDKAYILMKIREITYLPFLEMHLGCPFCGGVYDYQIDFNILKVNYLEDGFLTEEKQIGENSYLFQLPVKKDYREREEYIKKNGEDIKQAGTLFLATKIKTVNKRALSFFDKVLFIESLPGQDVVELLKLVSPEFGQERTFDVVCKNKKCKRSFKGVIGLDADLFR